MARLLLDALRQAGYAPIIVSRFRSHTALPDEDRQQRVAQVGGRLAARVAERIGRDVSNRPRAWFTYHLYYKAPDHLGPAVAAALDIPYYVAEASFAPKRATGPWRVGHEAVATAVGAARAVFCINPNDHACLLPLLSDPVRLVDLPPFLDAAPYRDAARSRPDHRRILAARLDLALEAPWLLAVAMMRTGDKLASYRLLADALARLKDRPWSLLVAGDGPAREAVVAAFAGHGLTDRLRLLGALPGDALPSIYAAADLLVWPAIREAYGMALMEAQAAGVPVVAGNTDGVPAVVADNLSGLLTPPGDPATFAEAVAKLLDAGSLRAEFGRRASERIARHHTVDTAAAILRRTLELSP